MTNMTGKKPTRRAVLGGLSAGAVTLGLSTRRLHAQSASGEVTYNTFLDPANARDPRTAAQIEMIAEFEKAFPRIKVKVVVDPAGQNGIRAARAKSDGPDVIRVPNFSMPEFVVTGSMLPIEDLIARDKVDMSDWLIPLEQTKVNGRLWGLQQDFRIPIYFYRKSRFAEGQVAAPPRTFAEVGVLGPKLTKGNVMAYGIPIGMTGGIGGAQAFVEFLLSSLLPGNDGSFFAPDGRAIGFTNDRMLLAATTIRDLFVKDKAATPVSLQFGYNELQDGLRVGTVASATFGLHRYKGIEAQIANNDLAWAPPPAIGASDKQAVYGFQLCINSNSPNREAAWEFVKFMTSPAAQVFAGRGGEVVARASAYKDPYFQTDAAKDQMGWKDLVQQRGRVVTYSVIQSTFNQIVGEAFQRMILRSGTPEALVSEVTTRYTEALSKT